jgi:uncharacterized protein YfaP (DUF2135 family)
MLIKTGAELWSQLVQRAGLDLRRYDSAVEVAFRKNLRLPEKGNVVRYLEARKVEPEPVLGAFFGALQPFVYMFKDILDLVEAAGKTEGKENLLVEFDFEEGKKFKLDLNSFRQQVEYFRTVIRPIIVERWDYHRFWALWSAFGEDVSGYPDAELKDWADQYYDGTWPERDLGVPKFDNPLLAEYVTHAWKVRHATIEAARRISPRRDGLRGAAGGLNELEVADGLIEQSDGVAAFLSHLHSDHWALSIASKAYMRAIQARLDPTSVDRLVKSLSGVLNDPPPLRRDAEVVITEIQEFLSLPIWKRRYELYSIWVLTQIINALGGPRKFQFMIEGEVFHIPFSAKLIAVLQDMQPDVNVWSEVRYALAKPIGKTRKAGMQPDYSLAVDTQVPPKEAFALVECKQYLRASVKNFQAAVIDYANGQPNANVALVNYGPASSSILNGVPVALSGRIKIIGNLRPLREDSEREFREWIYQQTMRASTPQAGAATTAGELAPSGEMDAEDEAQIELQWNELPRDLDLHVFVATASGRTINYADQGTLESWPWLELNKDVRTGYGSEIVRIRKTVEGFYRIEVHSFSNDAPLTGCGAKVTIRVRGEESKTFSCPSVGYGSWWHVCDVDFHAAQIQEVNIIHAESTNVS